MNNFFAQLMSVLSHRWISSGIAVLIVSVANFSQLNNLPVDPDITRTAPGVVPSQLMQEIGTKEPILVQLPASERAIDRAIDAQLDGRVILVRNQRGAWKQLRIPRDADGSSLRRSQILEFITQSLNEMSADAMRSPN